MIDPAQPYVAVPSRLNDREMSAVRELLPSGVAVFDGSELPVFHFAGVGSGAGAVQEFGYWLINFGPAELWRLSAFLLSTYFGKKLIDGFASEAGKDLWGGVKALLHHISGKVKTEALPTAVTLRGSGQTVKVQSGEESPLYLHVNVQVHLPTEEQALLDFIECVERFALPLVSCLGAKADVVKLNVDPSGDPFPWRWNIWDLWKNEMFHADFKKRVFQLPDLDPDPKSEVGDCLKKLGLNRVRSIARR